LPGVFALTDEAVGRHCVVVYQFPGSAWFLIDGRFS
jgi:hypothetical protein